MTDTVLEMDLEDSNEISTTPGPESTAQPTPSAHPDSGEPDISVMEGVAATDPDIQHEILVLLQDAVTESRQVVSDCTTLFANRMDNLQNYLTGMIVGIGMVCGILFVMVFTKWFK